MAYSIHGNETPGCKLRLQLFITLFPLRIKKTAAMLDNMVVVIDPFESRGGRDGFCKVIEQYRGTAPNVDDPISSAHG
ncbi:MAG: hypothetical protein CM15mP51_24840 [Porticoccaceae bacterium]|nr:MAG: hypothetical protein CM15mP51_24840 [Porticoccaceae bacterium]